jgi:predicted glycosyltransferase involved in capsule biosynthesis
MNRTDRLEKMLPSWTKINKIKDFVIVDWSSEEPVINNKILNQEISKNHNIKVVRVENQKYFYRCLAWNLANRYTNPQNKILLKLDVDYVNIDESWMNYLKIHNSELFDYFITGSYEFLDHSLGFLLVNKKNFGKGYNENALPVWGFEDIELVRRIEQDTNVSNLKGYREWNNLQKIIFFNIGQYIYHIPHSDKERLQNLMCFDLIQNEQLNKWEMAMAHQKFLNNKNNWVPKEYEILEDSKHYTRLKLKT